MTRRVELIVLGKPEPQGSKTVARAKGRSFVRDDNRELEPWRQAVTSAALKATGTLTGPLTGPLRLDATFVLPRPRGHYGTGRNAGTLKPSAPLYVPTRPDTDKLVRAVGDAITGVICRDDAQLVIVHAEKHYGEPPHAHLVVTELELDDARAGPSEL